MVFLRETHPLNPAKGAWAMTREGRVLKVMLQVDGVTLPVADSPPELNQALHELESEISAAVRAGKS